MRPRRWSPSCGPSRGDVIPVSIGHFVHVDAAVRRVSRDGGIRTRDLLLPNNLGVNGVLTRENAGRGGAKRVVLSAVAPGCPVGQAPPWETHPTTRTRRSRSCDSSRSGRCRSSRVPLRPAELLLDAARRIAELLMPVVSCRQDRTWINAVGRDRSHALAVDLSHHRLLDASGHPTTTTHHTRPRAACSSRARP